MCFLTEISISLYCDIVRYIELYDGSNDMPENDTVEDVEVKQLARVLKEFAGEVMRHSARDMGCLIRTRDLSMPQVAALMYLRQHGKASISEIGDYLNLSLAAT